MSTPVIEPPRVIEPTPVIELVEMPGLDELDHRTPPGLDKLDHRGVVAP
ncbi:hypothetical protein [Nocardioides sp. R-C-SC26]|nr:hypothetical protein [Nocardioides sp. R-C-SC26]